MADRCVRGFLDGVEQSLYEALSGAWKSLNFLLSENNSPFLKPAALSCF